MAVTAEITGYFRVSEPGVSNNELKIAGSETAAEGKIEKFNIADGATYTVNFGSVGTGAKWFGYKASGKLTVKVNAEATGHVLDFLLMRSTAGDTITSATLANATGSAVTGDVIVVGS